MMRKWIALNKEELEMLMVLMGQNELRDIAVIDEGFLPREDVAQGMLQRGFFVESEDGRTLHSFVHFVMWYVFNADCVLHIWEPDSSVCNIYFKSDVMILLSKRADLDEYVFYFVPFIPQAIGGFSYFCQNLTNRMTADSGTDVHEFVAETEPDSIEALLQLLRKNGVGGVTDKSLALSVRGDVFDQPAYYGALLHTADGWMLAQAEDKAVTCSGVDGYELIKKLSDWIIATHGSCISWGMKNE